MSHSRLKRENNQCELIMKHFRARQDAKAFAQMSLERMPLITYLCY